MQQKSRELKIILTSLIEKKVKIKNQLTHTLKNKFNPRHLGKIEAFQNKLIKADQLLMLLRDDLAYLDRIINKGLPPGTPQQKEIHTYLTTLHSNVLATGKQFGYLKAEMDVLLSKAI